MTEPRSRQKPSAIVNAPLATKTAMPQGSQTPSRALVRAELGVGLASIAVGSTAEYAGTVLANAMTVSTTTTTDTGFQSVFLPNNGSVSFGNWVVTSGGGSTYSCLYNAPSGLTYVSGWLDNYPNLQSECLNGKETLVVNNNLTTSGGSYIGLDRLTTITTPGHLIYPWLAAHSQEMIIAGALLLATGVGLVVNYFRQRRNNIELRKENAPHSTE